MSVTCYFFNPTTEKLIETENELNFSNSNASDICAALGMETDFNNSGPTHIEDFREKCESFLNGDLKHFSDREIESKKDGNWITFVVMPLRSLTGGKVSLLFLIFKARLTAI